MVPLLRSLPTKKKGKQANEEIVDVPDAPRRFGGSLGAVLVGMCR